MSISGMIWARDGCSTCSRAVSTRIHNILGIDRYLLFQNFSITVKFWLKNSRCNSILTWILNFNHCLDNRYLGSPVRRGKTTPLYLASNYEFSKDIIFNLLQALDDILQFVFHSLFYTIGNLDHYIITSIQQTLHILCQIVLSGNCI